MAKHAGGHLYQRGRLYWMKYYVNGRPVYESTGTDKEKVAQRVLQNRLGRAATGQPILPRADRVKYTDGAKDLREHYTTSGERNLDEAEWRLAHLDRFFQHYRLVDVGPAEVTKYTAQRQAEGASNGTIRL